MVIMEEAHELVQKFKKSKMYKKGEHKYIYVDLADSTWGLGHYGDTIHVPEKPKRRTRRTK
jgi:hypothetical protein